MVGRGEGKREGRRKSVGAVPFVMMEGEGRVSLLPFIGPLFRGEVGVVIYPWLYIFELNLREIKFD